MIHTSLSNGAKMEPLCHKFEAALKESPNSEKPRGGGLKSAYSCPSTFNFIESIHTQKLGIKNLII